MKPPETCLAKPNLVQNGFKRLGSSHGIRQLQIGLSFCPEQSSQVVMILSLPFQLNLLGLRTPSMLRTSHQTPLTPSLSHLLISWSFLARSPLLFPSTLLLIIPAKTSHTPALLTSKL